ncbi:MAG: class I SAM-dependent methyltransferase [Bryobacteraceae bacterium]
MSESAEFDGSYADEQLRRARHPLRRAVKHFYLENILKEVTGPTVDLGCGAGQLLRRLPAGSMGLEVNRGLIDSLKAEGLPVERYDASADDFGLTALAHGRYETLVMAHVLEHFSDAEAVLRKLLASCGRLGISKVILVVPGARGFASDATHKTFVNRAYVEKHQLGSCDRFRLTSARHFPLNAESIGRLFVFHELMLVYTADTRK